ncbi:hypothetical protein Cgig2_023774 [Carnegiea gigantea]|uniref:DUF4283 domain-containing protein n=1 Tax=Carnegiea gigantea TaxID=171969 RepID=A0A9Q1GIR5_9CARY|nr:hypothetical protein Cgig2_023774 [Carnegiea gigantea]
MASGLEEEWKCLKLTEEEEEIIVCDEEDPSEKAEQVALCLLGKLNTTNYFNLIAMKAVEFTSTRLWVKAYDVPTLRQTPSFAKLLGNKVGTFVGCEDTTIYGIDKSINFKVDIDIMKPLKRGVRIQVENKPIWNWFEYVKLPDFCYAYGKLGHVYKGWNGQGGEGSVEKRLDRFCANTKWLSLFPDATVTHINYDLPDHLPIRLKSKPTRQRKAVTKVFHFEDMWASKPSCLETIKHAWSHCTEKDVCSKDLARRNRDTFGNVGVEIMRLEQKLRDNHDTVDRKHILAAISEWRRKEESGRWHVEFIRNIFLPCDAEVILDLPLSDSWPGDKLIWHFTQTGEFFVRSAYHMLINQQSLGASTSTDQSKKEDSKIDNRFWDIRVRTMVDCFKAAMENINLDELGEFLAVLWECWNARNCFIFQTPSKSLAILGARAISFVRGYRASHACETEGKVASPALWKPPESGWFKLNFAGGKNGESGRLSAADPEAKTEEDSGQ